MSFLFGLLFAANACAQSSERDHEKLEILGWGDGCAVAIAHYGYPAQELTGPDDAEEPNMTQIGVLGIAPGQTKQKDGWRIYLHGSSTYRPKEAEKVLAQLTAEGYTKPGWVEDVGNPVVAERDLPRLLGTADVLKAAPGKPLPGAGWRWTKIIYEPVSYCALFVYAVGTPDKPAYDYRLVRVNNPAARPERAAAHLTNALLLLGKGDLDSAVLEAGVAARIDPGNAAAHYHHATLLALSGEVETAVDELEAAVKLDPQYKKKARKDKDLETLRWHPRFKELTKG